MYNLNCQEAFQATTEKEHEEENCLVQVTQGMDIRPVQIRILVWWVQIGEFWFHLQCLCQAQKRWTGDSYMCVSHRKAWRRRCEGVGLLRWWHCWWFIRKLPMFIILFFSYTFIHSYLLPFSLDICQLAEASLARTCLGIPRDFIVTDRNRIIYNRTVEILKETKPLQDEFDSFRSVCETWRIPSQKLKIPFQKPSSTSVLYICVFSFAHMLMCHYTRAHAFPILHDNISSCSLLLAGEVLSCIVVMKMRHGGVTGSRFSR